MQIRRRTSKSVARRHDLNYFKKGSPLRRWQGILTLAALGCSLIWLAGSWAFRGPQLLSKGPVASSHAVFGEKCESCHLPVKGNLFHRAGFLRDVPDSACRRCHAVPDHQVNQTFTPHCGSCHVEHTGSMMLAHTANQGCTQCHANLRVKNGTPLFATAIDSFVKEHPEFRPLRPGFHDEQAIKFAHAEHLKTRRPVPNGPIKTECGDCHHTIAESRTNWAFASPAVLRDAGLDSATPFTSLARDHGRAYMSPVAYATDCHDCHKLIFDKHIHEEAPHTNPADVRAFIALKIRSYAAEHPEVVAAEIRNWVPEPSERVPGKPIGAVPHSFEEWVIVRIAQSERRIWAGSCRLCHVMRAPDLPIGAAPAELAVLLQTPANLPIIKPTRQPVRWLTHAKFSHQAHEAVACADCHRSTEHSQNAADILLPSIETCRRCHNGESRPQGPALSAGHAESGCFLCHEYHGWDRPGAITRRSHGSALDSLGLLAPAR